MRLRRRHSPPASDFRAFAVRRKEDIPLHASSTLAVLRGAVEIPVREAHPDIGDAALTFRESIEPAGDIVTLTVEAVRVP